MPLPWSLKGGREKGEEGKREEEVKASEAHEGEGCTGCSIRWWPM